MLMACAAWSSCSSGSILVCWVTTCSLLGPMLRGNTSLLHPSLSALLLPLTVEEFLQEANHSLGVNGARRQDGGQTHTGCKSLCAATSHSCCDSSAQSSFRLMQLPSITGREGGGHAAEVPAVHPLLAHRAPQGRSCAQQSSPHSVHGRSSRGCHWARGEAQRGGKPSFVNMMYNCFSILGVH